jgi:hypothetical protein
MKTNEVECQQTQLKSYLNEKVQGTILFRKKESYTECSLRNALILMNNSAEKIIPGTKGKKDLPLDKIFEHISLNHSVN